MYLKPISDYSADIQALVASMLQLAEDDRGDPNQRARMALNIQDVIDRAISAGRVPGHVGSTAELGPLPTSAEDETVTLARLSKTPAEAYELGFVDSLQRQLAEGRRPSAKQIEALDTIWERATKRG